ncbi:GntR family transcriptional regulator [Bacillus subtilis]|uniref:GntR family transcriptional regulator n=1 Tax=Bacillus subtilis TaxID=1423 RepID=UPI0010636579|nr:GntR family transcriptional regulator [Bacillus subtilis]TDU16790.1 GntR family transcriptional regulator [Bacillus subtilis]
MSRMKQVYDHLLEAIVSNQIPPGTPLVETDIADEMKMSRTPIREALKELEAEGLVSRYQSRGTVVSHITPYDVEEIFTVRITLELCALQLSWQKITDYELKEVEKLFLALNSTSSKQDYHHADKTLHSLIINRAGNSRLKKFLNLLNSQIERFRRIAADEPTRLTRSKKEHLEIIHFLKKRDLQACEESLKTHLINVKNSTLEQAKLFAVLL